MSRPKGPAALPAWRKFADARTAHYRDGAPRSVLVDAAAELNAWAESTGPAAGGDFGRCPDLEAFDIDEPVTKLGARVPITAEMDEHFRELRSAVESSAAAGTLPDVERVTVLEPGPDDVVVIELSGNLPVQAFDQIGAQLRDAFGPARVVVLAPGVRLAGVVRADALVTAG